MPTFFNKESLEMSCESPIKIWKNNHARLDIPAADYYELKKVSFKEVPERIQVEIPCGKCLGCRLDHAGMWATRIAVEAKNWKKNCFITLTYNDNNLPLTDVGLMTLLKKDVQDFLKRLRYYEKGNEEWENPVTGKIENPIRYFCCGEYGPKGGRPHYHMAIFNWEPDDLKLWKQNKHGDPMFMSKKLQKIWGNGFVVVEELNFNSASYIARYTLKKAGLSGYTRIYSKEFWTSIEKDERFQGEIWDESLKYWEKWHRKTIKPIKETEDEFIIMSRGAGIGVKYWNENKDKIKRNKGILLKIKDKVKLKPIPRYYLKLWEKENWRECERFKYKQHEEAERKKYERIKKLNLPGLSDDEKLEWLRKQDAKFLKENLNKYKRIDVGVSPQGCAVEGLRHVDNTFSERLLVQIEGRRTYEKWKKYWKG